MFDSLKVYEHLIHRSVRISSLGSLFLMRFSFRIGKGHSFKSIFAYQLLGVTTDWFIAYS